MATKILKEDEYVGRVQKFAVYVDKELRTVGIYATNEDALVANRSKALKKLVNTYKYHVQMVIK